MADSAERARNLFAAALLTVLAIGSHANALDAPFLFDDRPAVMDNPSIRRLWPPRFLLAPPRDTPVAGRPLVNASLALNFAVGGTDPRGYHALNLAIHTACALLLFGLVRRTLAGRPALRPRAGALALAAAALWVVHPLTTECVAYVTQRTESLMAFFYLLTLYALARVHAAGGAAARGAWTGVCVASCALGMLSKETMVTAPLVALLYDVSYGAGSPREALRRRPLLYAGLASSWIALALLLAAGPRSGSVGPSLGVSPASYLANQAWVIPAYLKRVVWPHPLVFDYGWPRPRDWTGVLPELAALAALGLAIVAVAWRRPALGFPALAALLVLAPTSSFVPIVTEVGAERRMYLPLAAVSVLVVVAGHALAARLGGAGRPLGALAVAGAVLALAGVTRARNADYRSAEAIWRTVVAAVPENPRGLLNLGEALRAQGQAGAAESYFRRALEVYPGYARAEAHLGLLARDRGDLAAAERHLRRALELDPRHGDIRSNLGELLARSGRASEALDEWREALARDPELALAANNLAWTLATHPDPALRDGDAALRWAREAAERTAYSDAGVLDTLGAAQAEVGQWEAAQASAARALALAEAEGSSELARAIRARRDGYARREAHRDLRQAAPVAPARASPSG